MSNYTNQTEIDIKQGETIVYKSIFDPYVHIIKNSEKKERKINKKSEDDLTENTLKIKKLLEEEEKKISHSELSSYDPTEFNNNLQFLSACFDKKPFSTVIAIILRLYFFLRT